jgi:hypothetical protein
MSMAVAREIKDDFAHRDTVLYVPGTLKMDADDFARFVEGRGAGRAGIVAHNVEIVPSQRPRECTDHRGQALDGDGRCTICGGVRTKVTLWDIGTAVWNWWNGN